MEPGLVAERWRPRRDRHHVLRRRGRGVHRAGPRLAAAAALSLCCAGPAPASERLVTQRPVPCAAVKLLAGTTGDGDFLGVAWSPNGRFLAYAEDPTGKDGYSLRVMRARGGRARTLATDL